MTKTFLPNTDEQAGDVTECWFQFPEHRYLLRRHAVNCLFGFVGNAAESSSSKQKCSVEKQNLEINWLCALASRTAKWNSNIGSAELIFCTRK